ncbi:MAG: aminoacyl-tRNA hydrolase, partial [Vicinamibacteria bacterium]
MGFEAVDRILRSTGGRWEAPGDFAVEATASIEGRAVTLMKPLRFMNLSGGPVAAWVRTSGIERTEVLVYLDDVALPMGSLRLRERGTDGGHRGLASLLEALGGTDVPRVRIGIRPREESPGDARQEGLADFVLSPFTAEERRLMDEVLDRT